MTTESKIIKKDEIDKKVKLDSRLDLPDTAESVSTWGKKIISREDLGDMKQAKTVIDKAMAEAGLIRKKAKELYLQIETKMAEAKKAGFEQGCENGKATVTQRLVEIQKQNEEFLEKIEKQVLNLVCRISEKIIGEMIQTSDKALAGLVRQALLAVMGNKLTVYVNPEDLERLKDHENKLVSCLDALQTMSLKPGPNVSKGGCLIESELGTIDAQLEVQIAAIKRALGVL